MFMHHNKHSSVINNKEKLISCIEYCHVTRCIQVYLENMSFPPFSLYRFEAELINESEYLK